MMMSNEIKKLFLVEGEIFNGSNLQSTWYQAEVSARNKDHAETLARDEFRKQGAFQEVDIKSIECIDEIVDIDSFYEQQEHVRYISQSNAELERGKREVEEWRENRQLLGHDMAEAIAIQRELEEGY